MFMRGVGPTVKVRGFEREKSPSSGSCANARTRYAPGPGGVAPRDDPPQGRSVEGVQRRGAAADDPGEAAGDHRGFGLFGAVRGEGNIDKLLVVDQGGNGEHGGGSLGRLAKTCPAVVINVVQQLEALGLNVPTVLRQLGVNPAACRATTDRPAAVPAVREPKSATKPTP
jgi:hypothetical protein